jgi:hypothetical protein
LEGGLEPILWRVLSVENGEAYLVSEYVLFHHRVHSDDTAYIQSGGAFEKTELFAYLNGPFLKNFSQDELAMLADQGASGKMTLLTAEDLRNSALGFGTNTSRSALGTPYAVNNGLFQYTIQFGSTSPYWTRTQNTGAPYGACCTKANGSIGYIRVVVQNEGCRPACALQTDAIQITLGDGTKGNPFRLMLNKGCEE